VKNPSATIDERKKSAITLRLEGKTLAEVAAKTGFSLPTISALVKAYEKGGWQAIESRKPGRPKGGSCDANQELTELRSSFLAEQLPGKRFGPVFTVTDLVAWFSKKTNENLEERTAIRRLTEWGFLPPDHPLCAGTLYPNSQTAIFWARGPKGEVFIMPSALPLTDEAYCAIFRSLGERFPKGLTITLDFAGIRYTPLLNAWLTNHPHFKLAEPKQEIKRIEKKKLGAHQPTKGEIKKAVVQQSKTSSHARRSSSNSNQLTHLQRLEAEAIYIMREVVAEAENPVMLYSIGKDSTVMVRLAVKAFYPAKVPFPLLHIDSTWEFQQMYAFSQWLQKEHDLKLISYVNQEGIAQGINPFTHGSQIHTDVLRTQGLKQALDQYGFDIAFGGGRRDEEKSRAKERIFSFRTKDHRWDPKNQRPELWNLYNTRKHQGESIRVFPISNWTELDIWQYIRLEQIPIVPLYLSAPRPVVNRDGTLIMVDDERMPLAPGEVPMVRNVRFRTLGCYPFTGAVESTATTLEDIIQEMLLTKTSERQGRVIDHDSAASMEKKKQEGYF
jgi:sulfate adenylyltransferase subunit 2